jgi:glycosyltransferase involved in cell wall biosynthesis
MLISCIIVTERRPQFITRAIEMFSAQTHREKELVIMDGFHEPSVTVPMALKPEVVYLRCPNYTQGRRLDHGLRCASGDVLVKWDDDDVYGAGYLSAVAGAYEEGRVMCLSKCLMRTVDGELRVRNGRYAGGSIVFDREVFRKIERVSDVNTNVDGDLFSRFRNAGVVVDAHKSYFEQYTYVRHGENTWNGMQSRMSTTGDIEHVTHDEWWKALPMYDGAKREEVMKWLQ